MIKLRQFIREANSTETLLNREWVPARPYRSHSLRSIFSDLWLVIAGRADVVLWPEDEFNMERKRELQ